MRAFRAIAGTSAILFLAGCSAAEQPATAAAVVAAKPACAKTVATPADQRPPVLADTTGSWYGSADLWVGLPDHPATAGSGAVELKFPWVTLSGDKPSKDVGLPEVSAVRTDAPSPVPAAFGDYARVFGTSDLAFWPSTIEFPGAGCWTVTGKLNATTVQFVVDVKA